MNSSNSALLSAIIGTALLVVAFGLIVAFVPKGKPAVKAQGNLPVVADAPNGWQLRSREIDVYLAFVMTSGLARPSDMHRLSRQVRFVPCHEETCQLFDDLVGAGNQR